MIMKNLKMFLVLGLMMFLTSCADQGITPSEPITIDQPVSIDESDGTVQNALFPCGSQAGGTGFVKYRVYVASSYDLDDSYPAFDIGISNGDFYCQTGNCASTERLKVKMTYTATGTQITIYDDYVIIDADGTVHIPWSSSTRSLFTPFGNTLYKPFSYPSTSCSYNNSDIVWQIYVNGIPTDCYTVTAPLTKEGCSSGGGGGGIKGCPRGEVC